MFTVLLINIIVNACNHTKCVSLSNQKCEIQTTLTVLDPNEYNQELHYYPFAVKSDKSVGSCNFLNALSNGVCVPNKTEILNINVFNMITEKNESKILIMGILCNCNCWFDGKKV